MSNPKMRGTDRSPDRHLVLLIRPARPGTIRSLKVVQRGMRHVDLVYGELEEGLVFLPFCKALMLSGLHMALAAASTWGELLPMLPSTWYDGLVALQRDFTLVEGAAGGPDPATQWEPEADSDLDVLSGLILEGDFPDWPEQDVFTWMPRPVIEQFGQVVSSVLNGEYLVLPAHRETAIVAALAEYGFRCTRDDELVRRAKGYR